MREKIIFWLSFAIIFSLFLHSCVHDEISSSANPSNYKYSSKTLWKEDEVYIKNIIKIYQEHETEIKKTNGHPFWDYATTLESYDESFLMVPIVENNTVTSVLQVPRNGQRAYFYYTNYKSHLGFFQNLIFSTYKKVLPTEKSSGATAKGMSCTRTFYSVWMPNNEGSYDPGGGDGHWNTYSVIKCRQMMDECMGTVNEYGECSGGGGGGGYPYPGGGGGENPEPEIPDPCKKTKTVLQKPEVQAKVQTLKEKANANGNEFGFKIKSDGTTSPLIQGGKDKLDFGDMNGYSGFYHVHPGIIGINIFSPPDIQSLFTAIITAGNSSTVSDIYFGVIGSEICQSCPGESNIFIILSAIMDRYKMPGQFLLPVIT
ncbi:hypothetical protein ODZ84_12195 [Chryseobacterium fluminis]|uniref:hypothetical protein n=1 Tax=Chryseobacterium fluminis TaxID=2983606 RepID=UPI002258B687|nr:hypothetical protein [Chryseobacterium sp. MMS21-Ot14]UZT96001.1 hypothetical protein ODZ84_12195 [Chryseobacterium sp. MMS21-Ot14]